MRVASVSGVQYAALPWRVRSSSLEILLITTLNTKRWIVPKGWPIDGLAPCECAELEALEEAGVSGEVATEALGGFMYLKQRKHGEPLSLRIEVYPLRVTHQKRHWAERLAREASWCQVPEAMNLIGNPGLRRLVAKFAQEKQLVAVA